MNLGVIGLGRMGHAIAYRVIKGGFTVIGYDPIEPMRFEVEKLGATVVDNPIAVAQHTRVIWLMVPAGPLVDSIIQELLPHLKSGDVLIDGGNSHYNDSLRRAKQLADFNIHFLDCGTSGGLRGQEEGFSLMVGGDEKAYLQVYPLLQAIAAPEGVGYVGPSGAGHYVKMVHNGIEYALMQAYAEGFQLIKEGTFKDQDLDLQEITSIWMHGAVIRSWLLELSHDIFKRDQKLHDVSGVVDATGMGKWTVEEAHKNNIPVKLIEDALAIRQQSHKTGGDYATKVVALLRHAFGGHAVHKVNEK
ncbi:MAG TPA: decarboxylating 6-phosphogluconate dehydrogenase [Candidatus Babeliales bacterium]|nr:decarboxylating 6-phosphogluconate dehydrogenase [Candidatus Babeliales bacterium]